MPPIPITFQFPPPSLSESSTGRKRSKGKSSKGRSQPISFTYDSAFDTPSTIQSSKDEVFNAPPNDGPTTAARASRRKNFVVVAPPSKHVTFTPLYRPIISRCIEYTASLSDSSSPQSTPGIVHAHPYSPASDWGNNRSHNPSVREVLRGDKPKKLSKAEIRAKKEREDKVKRLVRELKGESVEDEEDAPAIVEETPTPPFQEEPVKKQKEKTVDKETLGEPRATSTPAPLPRTSLKRTRSFNVLAQNGNGVHAASPLRAVIGANGYEANDDQPSAKQPRKTSTSVFDTPGRRGRAFTHSPSRTVPEPLPAMAKSPRTVPLTAGVLQPSRMTRGGRSVSAALATAAEESASLRRSLSSDAAGRAGSVGLDGLAALRERSRREVTLPERLRDYDT